MKHIKKILTKNGDHLVVADFEQIVCSKIRHNVALEICDYCKKDSFQTPTLF